MAMLYIHIPFCRKACHYCNFHFSTSLKYKNDLLQCILKEIKIRREELQHETIRTIYFGGGTPSVLLKEDLARILDEIYSHYNCSVEEITIETNPDDLTYAYLKDLSALSIHRLSIGIQSFHDDDLSLLNRTHHAAQARKAVLLAKEVGFENISIDLMFGLPYQTQTSWIENVGTAIKLDVQHISSYSLTIEERTALAHFVQKKSLTVPEQEDYAQMYGVLIQMLTDNGFQHYEISNFAKEGFISKHNSGYWKGAEYLGFGPSAHSYNIVSRRWNIANNAQYIAALHHGKVFWETEELSLKNRINEAIMLGLRTSWGWDISKLDKEFLLFQHQIQSNLQRELQKGNLIEKNNVFYLTASAKYISDHVFANLFIS